MKKKAKQDRRGCPASPTKEEKRKLHFPVFIDLLVSLQASFSYQYPKNIALSRLE